MRPGKTYEINAGKAVYMENFLLSIYTLYLVKGTSRTALGEFFSRVSRPF